MARKLTGAFMSADAVATAFGVAGGDRRTRAAIKKALERWRSEAPDNDWLEAANPCGRAPRYHYRFVAVAGMIDDILSRRVSLDA